MLIAQPQGVHGLCIEEWTPSHIMCRWSSSCGPWNQIPHSALRWLVQVKKTLRMYIDNYDYQHTTIAKGDDVTGSSMFHFWLHQVPTCTLH